MRRPLRLMIFVMLLVSVSSLSRAGALKLENYSEVLIENLQIGNSYSMIKLANLPLKVKNLSDQSIVVALETLTPESKNLKRGFEPIPDLAWIGLGNTLVAIAANSMFQTDVQVTIPNEGKYFGKKYQVDIRSRILPTGGTMAISLAVEGKMLFTIASVKGPLAQTTTHANLAYAMSPERFDLKEVAVGKKIEVLSEGKSLRLKNESQTSQKFIFSSLEPQNLTLKIEAGAEAAPNPLFLTFSREEVTLGAGQERPIRMFLELPDKPEYRDRKFQFVVSVQTGTVARYLRVMVSTKK